MKTENMTDHEVIETLARREGWKRFINDTGVESVSNARLYLPPYLKSKDALAPLLAGLTDEEWGRLLVELQESFIHQNQRKNAKQFCLTIPPADLARAIAEVLKGGK